VEVLEERKVQAMAFLRKMFGKKGKEESMAQERRFPSPFEVLAKQRVPGTEGWERMYPYYYLFSEERREFEEKQLWFWDAMHHPYPMFPFDLIHGVCWQMSLSGYTTRVFAIPPANGIAHRLLNGYFYITPQATPPDEIGERVPLFQKRMGFYFEKWNELYDKWVPKQVALIEETKKLEFKDLPKFEDESVVLEHVGLSSGYKLLENYNKLILNIFKNWQYHFEFLNLVYLAYVLFFDFCTKAFPEIHPNTISKMVAGMGDVMMFRPDAELIKLARLAVNIGVADVFKRKLPAEETLSVLGKTDRGKGWLSAMENAKWPWFYTSTGTGFFHTEVGWIDNLSVPLEHIRSYIETLEKGGKPERPVEAIIAERERLRKEYRELLPTEDDKKAFDQSYGAIAMAYPYAENHIFYCEHWFHTVMWQKMRELGRVLVKAGFFKEPDDIFYFWHSDITPILEDLAVNWAVGPGTPTRGAGYWAKEVAWRKGVLAKLREWAPPPALGPIPERITEPFTIQLWGITSDTLETWLAPKPKPEEVTELKGFPSSAGVGEGPARVIIEVEKLGELQPGEILVCPCTSPSWAPAFPKIKGAVTDIGGMSCHASIVAREYGLPAVTGTGFATKVIKTGDRIKVDGTAGVVTIVKRQ
jgi:pyruvate,water dikinase